jgi:hypothetical protein
MDKCEQEDSGMCTSTCVSTLPVRTIKRSQRCRPEVVPDLVQGSCCGNPLYASSGCLPTNWPTLQRSKLPTCDINCLGCPIGAGMLDGRDGPDGYTPPNSAHESFSVCGRDPTQVASWLWFFLLIGCCCCCCCGGLIKAKKDSH